MLFLTTFRAILVDCKLTTMVSKIYSCLRCFWETAHISSMPEPDQLIPRKEPTQKKDLFADLVFGFNSPTQ